MGKRRRDKMILGLLFFISHLLGEEQNRAKPKGFDAIISRSKVVLNIFPRCVLWVLEESIGR